MQKREGKRVRQMWTRGNVIDPMGHAQISDGLVVANFGLRSTNVKIVPIFGEGLLCPCIATAIKWDCICVMPEEVNSRYFLRRKMAKVNIRDFGSIGNYCIKLMG